MKGPRSWNRREFAVTANGFFTVLKPTGWFSAARLPEGFRYLTGRSKGSAAPRADENSTAALPTEPTSVPELKALDHADSQETAMLSQSMIPSTHDHSPTRPALIVLAATAITAILLWWIVDPY
jgi:hypothetical protein